MLFEFFYKLKKTTSIIDTYGYCFDEVFKDGKHEDMHKAKLDVAKNFLRIGID